MSKYAAVLAVILMLAGTTSANKKPQFSIDPKEHTGFLNWIAADHSHTDVVVSADNYTAYCNVDDHSVSCSDYGGGYFVTFDDGTKTEVEMLNAVNPTDYADGPLVNLELAHVTTFAYRIAVMEGKRYLVIGSTFDKKGNLKKHGVWYEIVDQAVAKEVCPTCKSGDLFNPLPKQ